jgi:hypothetical protein
MKMIIECDWLGLKYIYVVNAYKLNHFVIFFKAVYSTNYKFISKNCDLVK